MCHSTGYFSKQNNIKHAIEVSADPLTIKTIKNKLSEELAHQHPNIGNCKSFSGYVRYYFSVDYVENNTVLMTMRELKLLLSIPVLIHL